MKPIHFRAKLFVNYKIACCIETENFKVSKLAIELSFAVLK